MNMMITATAIAAATSLPAAMASAQQPHDVLVMELFPPAGPNANHWNALTLDGSGQRWGVAARRDGEIAFAFREDRSGNPTRSGNFSWWQEDAPEAVRVAVGRAIAERMPLTIEQTAAADPAFAAVERHRAAWREVDAAVGDFNARQERMPKEFIGPGWVPIPDFIEQDGELLAAFEDGEDKIYRAIRPDQIEALSRAGVGCDVPDDLKNLVVLRFYSNKSIADSLPWDSCEGLRVAARRLLRSAKRKARNANVAAGIPEAKHRVDCGWSEEREALQALALTIPTTAAGARAVIEYWCHHFKENLADVVCDDDVAPTMRLLTSLHAAVGTIATPFSA